MARGRPRIEPGAWGEITAVELEPGKWQASVFAVTPLGKKKRHRVTRSTKGAAKADARKMAEGTARDTTTDSALVKPTTTITELIAAHLDNNDLSGRSKEIYQSVADNHVFGAIGDLQVRQTTTPAVEAFLHTLTPGTAKTAQALLSGAFTQAKRWGVIDRNPVQGTTRPRSVRRDPEALNREQLAEYRHRVIAYQTMEKNGPTTRAEPLLRLVDVFAGTGARPAEVLAMQWGDLDLEAQQPTAELRGTKTENAPRRVQLPKFTVQALKDQRDALGPLADLYPHVWQTSAGTPLSTASLNRWLRAVREHWKEEHKGEVDPLPNVTAKTFRKTVATIIADQVGEYEASRQLGHGDTAVTRKHYLQAPPLGPAVAGVLDGTLMAQ